MLGKGINPAENMLPEVAYVKLAWALGQTEDFGKVKDLMLTPIAGEITVREPIMDILYSRTASPRSKSSSANSANELMVRAES